MKDGWYYSNRYGNLYYIKKSSLLCYSHDEEYDHSYQLSKRTDLRPLTISFFLYNKMRCCAGNTIIKRALEELAND